MSQLTFDEVFNEENPAKAAEPAASPSSTSPKKDSWYKGRVLSHSSVSLYQQCPQKWKFRYVDKVPEKPRSYFSFGKSVHAGLEFLFSQFTEAVPTLDDVLAHYKRSWLSEGYDSISQEKWFYQEGERILRGFYVKHKGDAKKVFKTELKFTVDIEGVPMLGYIDRLDQTPSGKISIIDYKTGKAFDKSRARKDPQLTLYQIACREMFGKEIESLTLYHLNSLTPITVSAHSSTLEAGFRTSLVETAREISAETYTPKVDEKGHCRWCDYAQICPAFADKKKPHTERLFTKDSLVEAVDRYGKLDHRINQLNQEKQELKEKLRLQLEKSGTKEATGNHYNVKLKPANNGEEPTLDIEER